MAGGPYFNVYITLIRLNISSILEDVVHLFCELKLEKFWASDFGYESWS